MKRGYNPLTALITIWRERTLRSATRMEPHMPRRATIAVCFLLTLGAGALAQTAPENNKPGAAQPAAQPPSSPESAGSEESMDPPMLGDHWTYDVHDEITGELKFSTTNIITDLTPTEVAIRVQSPSFAGPGIYIYDRNWDLKNSPIWRVSPNDGTGVKLPLNVGSAWKFQNNAIYSARGTTFRNVGSSKVVARESVTTGAGAFDTFKIETSVNGHNANDPTKRFAMSITTWYAPSIDHWVRRISKTSFDGHVDDDSSIELVDYGRR